LAVDAWEELGESIPGGAVNGDDPAGRDGAHQSLKIRDGRMPACAVDHQRDAVAGSGTLDSWRR
jgi:hypothetical protein